MCLLVHFEKKILNMRQKKKKPDKHSSAFLVLFEKSHYNYRFVNVI